MCWTLTRQAVVYANIVANNTLKAIKQAMGIDYFDDSKFEDEQIKLYQK